MSGFKETEIGLMPESWDIVPFEQTGEVVYGIQAAVANLTKPIGTKILTNINITVDGKINLNQLRYYPLTKARHFKTVLKKGDILFNWRSGSKDHVGKTAFFDLDGEFTHSSFILRIRTNDKVVNKYIFYYLTYLRSSGYFRKLQNYSVNAKFNASAVNALPTAVPLYKEQQNITHILSKIQSAIETQEKIIQTTTELKKALMQKFFTEGLKGEAQKETEIGLVPKSWEIKLFEDIVTLQRGKDLPKDKFVQGEFPVGGSNGIIGYHNQFNTKAPGITVGRSGSCGKVVFYDKNFWAHNTALVVKDFHSNNEKFIYYFLCSLKLEKYKSGVSVPTLNRNAFRTINMAIPKIDEQIEIAKTLEQTDKKINMAIEKKNVLLSLFKSMLHHLMTGQIRVKDLKFS